MKWLGLFLFFPSLSLASAQVEGFLLVPWQDCRTSEICKIVGPKTWKNSEASDVGKILVELRRGGLSHLLDAIQSTGYRSLERLTNSYIEGFSGNQKNYRKNLDPVAFTRIQGDHLTIAFTDNYFKKEKRADPVSGVSMRKIILLHELVHAFDKTLDTNMRFTANPEFLKLAGFDSKFQFNKVSTEALRKAHIEDTNNEVVRKNPTRAMQFQRSFGKSIGLPRLYSTRNPVEALADLAAFIYYDRSSSSYIDKKLIQFVDRHVLKGARAF